MHRIVPTQEDVDELIARGETPSPEQFDALFARWRTLSPDVRDAEQSRLSKSLTPAGRDAWDRKVWLDTCSAMQSMADEAFVALNGRQLPMLDEDGTAIDFWRSWKEHWVA